MKLGYKVTILHKVVKRTVEYFYALHLILVKCRLVVTESLNFDVIS